VTAQAVKSGDLPVKRLAFTGFGRAIIGSSGNMGVITACREIGTRIESSKVLARICGY